MIKSGHFDFEKLKVYQRSLEFYALIRRLKFSNSVEDRIISAQLHRAALSVSLNIAEGSGKRSLKDRRNFFTISRGSIFECAAIILVLQHSERQSVLMLEHCYELTVEIGKMLSALILNLDNRISNQKPRPPGTNHQLANH
jgi:four helix bundle protein